MSFVVRPVDHDDLNQLYDLARQFHLLNLPGDKKVLTRKIEISLQSFSNELKKDQSEYLFVLEDNEQKQIVGSSLIQAKHGNEDVPHSYFKIFEKKHYSTDLGIGFIHQALRIQIDFDGPTEIGGLLVDKSYRKRPEKLGKQISLSRFLYMGMHPDKFTPRVLCELTPILTEEGRSEFWEALGRRFTGLNYQEADRLSQTHKGFIESLFPDEDIYMCLLDAQARTAVGRVGEHTKPAQHLLESIGFKYLNEVDPFDGGPHYGAQLKDVLPIKLGRNCKIKLGNSFQTRMLVATYKPNFKCALVLADIQGDKIIISERDRKILDTEEGEDVYCSPFNFSQTGAHHERA